MTIIYNNILPVIRKFFNTVCVKSRRFSGEKYFWRTLEFGFHCIRFSSTNHAEGRNCLIQAMCHMVGGVNHDIFFLMILTTTLVWMRCSHWAYTYVFIVSFHFNNSKWIIQRRSYHTPNILPPWNSAVLCIILVSSRHFVLKIVAHKPFLLSVMIYIIIRSQKLKLLMK